MLKGCLELLFVPEVAEEGGAYAFRPFLLNLSQQDFLCELLADTEERDLDDRKERLAAQGFLELKRMYKDDLNDKPIYRFRFWEQKTKGTGPEYSCEICLRPGSFFAKRQYHERLGREVYVYALEPAKVDAGRESLSDYTRRHAGHAPRSKRRQYVDVYNPREFASFPREIDLHIHALRPDAGKLEPGLILQIQIRAFEDYLHKAIRLGVEQVLIIHGKGEGVLRQRIHQLLAQNPYVRQFEKIHPILGTGATEVFF